MKSTYFDTINSQQPFDVYYVLTFSNYLFCLSADVSWDWIQPSATLQRISGHEKLMYE